LGWGLGWGGGVLVVLSGDAMGADGKAEVRSAMVTDEGLGACCARWDLWRGGRTDPSERHPERVREWWMEKGRVLSRPFFIR
jgi:hypothetical protein